MTPLYVVIGTLAATNVVTLVVLYKLVTQLSSKVMAGNLDSYTVATTPVKHNRTPGSRSIQHNDVVPIDAVDPRELMKSLAAQTGRLEDFEEV